jgi:hypothetical protein
MGSVIDQETECPKCKQHKGYLDFYYKSGEFWFQCFNKQCNYGHSVFIKRDNEGNPLTIDETDNYKFDNLMVIEEEYIDGEKTVKEYPYKDQKIEETN